MDETSNISIGFTRDQQYSYIILLLKMILFIINVNSVIKYKKNTSVITDLWNFYWNKSCVLLCNEFMDHGSIIKTLNIDYTVTIENNLETGIELIVI